MSPKKGSLMARTNHIGIEGGNDFLTFFLGLLCVSAGTVEALFFTRPGAKADGIIEPAETGNEQCLGLEELA